MQRRTETKGASSNVAILAVALALALVIIVPAVAGSASATTFDQAGCGCMPSIALYPQLQHAIYGNPITFNAVVTNPGCACGSGDTYQWYNDSTGTPVIIPGATSLTFTETAGSLGGFAYMVTISDGVNTNQSNIGIVQVCGCDSTTESTSTTTSASTTDYTTSYMTSTTTQSTSTEDSTIQPSGGPFQQTGGLPPITSTAYTTVSTIPTTAATTIATIFSTTSTTMPTTITVAPQVAPGSSSTTVPVTIVDSSGKSGGTGPSQPLPMQFSLSEVLWALIALIILLFLMGMLLNIRNRGKWSTRLKRMRNGR